MVQLHELHYQRQTKHSSLPSINQSNRAVSLYKCHFYVLRIGRRDTVAGSHAASALGASRCEWCIIIPAICNIAQPQSCNAVTARRPATALITPRSCRRPWLARLAGVSRCYRTAIASSHPILETYNGYMCRLQLIRGFR